MDKALICKLEIEWLITSDSITVYFDKPENLPEEYKYQIFLNGKIAGESDKTHFMLERLDSSVYYDVQVKVMGNGETLAESSVLHLHTKPAGKCLDVTKAPYMASGKGRTMDTQAIQQAIDDCKMGDTVYLPAGIYKTGALKLHSNMELYLEEGAILQGTDQPEDYLPRIWSRFEGTELSCYSSLLNMGELDHKSGSKCENILIRGKGTIASGGRVLAEKVIALEKEREMSGGVRDIKIWDCDMGNSLYGIEIKGTKKRGGYVRNVQVRDCRVARLLFHSVGYNDDGTGAGEAPMFEDCMFENVWITGKCLDHDGKYFETDCMELVGFDEPRHALKNFLLKDITLGVVGEARQQKLILSACEGITISNLKCL